MYWIKSISLYMYIIIASCWYTYIIDNQTLDTIWQKVLVLLYFIIGQGIIYMFIKKKRRNSLTRKQKGVYMFLAIVFASISVLLAKDTIIPKNSAAKIQISYDNMNDEFLESDIIWLCNVTVDDKEISLGELQLSEGWYYDQNSDDIKVISKKPQDLLLEFNNTEHIKLRFAYYNAFTNYTIIKVNNEEIPISIWEDEAGGYNLDINIVQKIGRKEIVTALIGIFVLAVVWYIILIINASRKKKKSDISKANILMLLIGICGVVLYCYWYNNAALRYLKIMLISVVGMYLVVFQIWEKECIKKYKAKKEAVILWIMNLYITFSFIGDYIFLPLGKTSISIRDIIVFFMLFFIFLPGIYILLFVFEIIKSKRLLFVQNVTASDKKVKWRKEVCIVLAIIYSTIFGRVLCNIVKVLGKNFIMKYAFTPIVILLMCFFSYYILKSFFSIWRGENEEKNNIFITAFGIVFLYQFIFLLICNPGIMTSDTFDQFAQAHKMIPFSDHHPAFHTLCEMVLYRIWDNPIIISIAQCLLFSSVIAYAANYLYKLKYNKKIILIYVIFNAITLNNVVTTISIWKDIPYCTLLLFFTTLCAKLVQERKSFYDDLFNNIQLFLVICFVGLFRHNGILIVTGMAVILLFDCINLRRLKSIVTIVGSIIFILVIKGPVFDYLNVAPNGSLANLIPMHGISYVNYEGKLNNNEVEEYMESFMPLSEWKELYERYSANNYLFTEKAAQYQLPTNIRNSSTIETIKNYLMVLRENPYLLIKDRLYGTDLLWKVTQGNSYNYKFGRLDDVYSNDMGVIHVENTLEYRFFDTLTYLASNPIIDIFMWRVGIYIDLLLVLIYFAYVNRMFRNVFCVLPILLNTVSLLLSMAWQEYRYVLYIFLCTGFIALYVFYEKEEGPVVREC